LEGGERPKETAHLRVQIRDGTRPWPGQESRGDEEWEWDRTGCSANGRTVHLVAIAHLSDDVASPGAD
jgi:hypothetical protein